jgi:hypothetical protein
MAGDILFNFFLSDLKFYVFLVIGAYRVLVGKPEGRRPLGRSRYRWEDNIRMDVRDFGWGMEWVDLAQDMDRWRAVVNAVMNLRFP